MEQTRKIRSIYRQKDLKKVEDEIALLGLDHKDHKKNNIYFKIMSNPVTYMNTRFLTSIIVFFFILYQAGSMGYIYAPTITVVYFYLFHFKVRS